MAEEVWAPSQSFSMGRVKIGGDAKPVEEPPKEDGNKDGNKSKSNGEDNES